MKLKFIIDKKYDIKLTKQFLGKKELQYVNDQYKFNLKYLNYSKREYQKSWDQINNHFSKYVKTETGYDWFHSTYYCVISAIHG